MTILIALNLMPMPPELFWWPQSKLLGGAGYPPVELVTNAVLLGKCPAARPMWEGRRRRLSPALPPPSRAHTPASPGVNTTATAAVAAGTREGRRDSETTTGDSAAGQSTNRLLYAEHVLSGGIRRSPRWIMDDLPCLNYSHLDAGVCVAMRSGKAEPTTMRCLPSFLVVSLSCAFCDFENAEEAAPNCDGVCRFVPVCNITKMMRIPAYPEGLRPPRTHVLGGVLNNKLLIRIFAHANNTSRCAAGVVLEPPPPPPPQANTSITQRFNTT